MKITEENLQNYLEQELDVNVLQKINISDCEKAIFVHEVEAMIKEEIVNEIVRRFNSENFNDSGKDI